MNFFIKSIFQGQADEAVHLAFQKFSKGKFVYRALIKVKNSKGKYSIGSGYEYANWLVRRAAEKLGGEKTKITGVVITTKDLANELVFKDKKQFQGVKSYVIDNEMSGKEILALCEQFPKSFIAFSFSVGDTTLKIKTKAPKSGKPSSKGDERPKPDFCKVKTTDKELVKELLFDIDINNFSEADVQHTYVIDDLIVSKDEKDPVKLRESAKRKGKVIRKIFVDGKEKVFEKEFIS